MKKNLYTLLLAFIALPMLLTSCDEDVEIGMSLEGTWEGNMYMSYSYNGRTFAATRSMIDFCADPFRSTSGTGYWIDFFNDPRYPYYANHFNWHVNNRVIYIEFWRERYTIEIHDFRIRNGHFVGWFRDSERVDKEFDLYKTSAPNWNDYNYGWDWYDSYGYARKVRSGNGQADSDSITVPFEYPVRHCIK